MIQQILKALKALEIPSYVISERVEESAELFFIRKAEDMRRAKRVHEAAVTVYRDFTQDGKMMRGSASVVIHPGMTGEETSAKLAAAYEAAQYVFNPFFELPDPVTEAREDDSRMRGLPLMDAAARMAEALFSADTAEDAFINSAEIFAVRARKRIITSRGTDVSFTVSSVEGELVAQCVSPVDVEMYFSFRYGFPDAAALSALSAEAVRAVRDRAQADHAPAAGQYTLILTKKHVAEILSAYVACADASLIYPHYSNFSVGCAVQGENVTGEKLDLSVFSEEPFSADGIPMPERPLIRDGILQCIHGETRFCRYLDLPPTGSYSALRVENGALPLAEMKKKPYIMPVAFSDFQMDPLSRRFGGEIRLAYLFDGEKISVVTGGSVSGSLLERQDRLAFSAERYTDSAYDGPYALSIPDVTVAGV